MNFLSLPYALFLPAVFAGYSDIAIGSARLLGVDLSDNFRAPVFARSLKDFWARWHISLSTWFRDYVYIPLGGSRRGAWRTRLNLLATFVLSGLWHGANLTFVVWGAIRVCTFAAPGARTLVLGDSVANQIFATGPSVTGAVAVATCNQAVTPLGNRILLDRWLALNPQAGEVVYVARPGSFANDGRPEFTFHYLLFPFAEAGLFDDAPPRTLDYLRRRFGRLPVDNASVRHLLYRNDRLYDFYERRIVRRPEPVPGGGLPEIVVENLRAMRDACAARDVRFRLAFPPVREDRKPSAAYLTRLADQLRDICPEIDDLVANLRAEPPEHFRNDVHLTRERLDEIRADLRAEILEGRERP